MARGKLRPYMVFTGEPTTKGYTVGASTITTVMMVPADGARLVQWGIHSTAVGVGNDPISAYLNIAATANTAANRLADVLTITPDLTTVNTNFVTYGPGGGGGGHAAPANSAGKLLSIDFNKSAAADKFVTMSTSYTVFALWSL